MDCSTEAAGNRKGLLAAAGAQDRVAKPPQCLSRQGAHFWLILHYENSLLAANVGFDNRPWLRHRLIGPGR